MNGGNLHGALGGSLPIAATDIAARWDTLYLFLFYLSLFFFVLVIGAMVWFAWKYRASNNHKTEYIHGHVPLEILWTAIPTVLVLIIFYWGWILYVDMVQPPANAYEIRVVGQQWRWTFQYDDGRVTENKVYVPANRPVKLIMSSKLEDVIHSFFVPDFRIKQDVVPGMYTSVWFQAKAEGKHQVFCAEYCGTAHSAMLADLYVLNDEQWKKFERGRMEGLPGNEPGQLASSGGSAPVVKLSPLAEAGSKLYQTATCVACHSIDGTKRVGPSWKGLYGSTEELSDGTKVKVDDAYIIESIEKPQLKITKGYEGLVMPPLAGNLKPDDIKALVEFIKSLK
ncbi:MAG: cytochrome c oxidase subunit II [Bacteriovoracia bacterium]